MEIRRANALWQVIRGLLIPVLMRNLCPTWLMTTLKRNLFTLVTNALLALGPALVPNAGLLLVSPRKVMLTPLRLVPDPGLMEIRTIGLGNLTDLRTNGRPGLAKELFAAALPKLTVVVTLLENILGTLPWRPERTRRR